MTNSKSSSASGTRNGGGGETCPQNEKVVTATLCFNTDKVFTNPIPAPIGHIDLREKIFKILTPFYVGSHIIRVDALKDSEIFYENYSGERITDDEGVKAAMSMEKPDFQLQVEVKCKPRAYKSPDP